MRLKGPSTAWQRQQVASWSDRDRKAALALALCDVGLDAEVVFAGAVGVVRDAEAVAGASSGSDSVGVVVVCC